MKRFDKRSEILHLIIVVVKKDTIDGDDDDDNDDDYHAVVVVVVVVIVVAYSVLRTIKLVCARSLIFTYGIVFGGVPIAGQSNAWVKCTLTRYV